MLTISVENIGDLALIDCKGRIVRSESVFELRDAVMSQRNSRIIALDLYQVEAIGGGALGMLAFLQRWAQDREIELKLFTPSPSVMDELQRTRDNLTLDIATLHDVMRILARAKHVHSSHHHHSAMAA